MIYSRFVVCLVGGNEETGREEGRKAEDGGVRGGLLYFRRTTRSTTQINWHQS